ncbi:MAG: BCCT family transporter [Deltaproteobacteria bacterium]|jgi:glycine betaine transporter|nr:BCCT family transporter [Deltaproteobacteria bacterium]
MPEQQHGRLVYGTSVAVVIAVVLYGLFQPEEFGRQTNNLFVFVGGHFGWWYMLAMNVFVVVPLVLALSRFGRLTMGQPGEKPEFSDLSWFGMLFGAGMGVGLVFYGVGEPLYHLASRPFGGEPLSGQAGREAMRATFFHWGLHPWASYSVIAICLSYFQFRKNSPALISSLFTPYLGPKGQDGALARVIDVLTIFATVGGIATSLGLAVLQISSGLNQLLGLEKSAANSLAILVVLAAAYIGSAISGLNKGIRYLGNFNLALFSLLAVALFLFGPSVKILETFMTSLGAYVSGLVSQSFDLAPHGGGYKSWLNDWTLYYWAWWIAWAPFVGSFVARISRGRTLRQFVFGVLLAPSLGCFTWFSIFGGTALSLEMSGQADLTSVVNADLSAGIFALYQHIHLGTIMSFLMLILICTFFVTSGNASTFVLSMYSSGGKQTPVKTKIFVWGILQAALAFVLMLSDGLKTLQIASILAALPFSLIMVLALVCFIKTARRDFPEGSTIS